MENKDFVTYLDALIDGIQKGTFRLSNDLMHSDREFAEQTKAANIEILNKIRDFIKSLE